MNILALPKLPPYNPIAVANLPKTFNVNALQEWQKISPTNCVGRFIRVSYANNRQFKVLSYLSRNGKGDAVEAIDQNLRSHYFLASECKFLTPYIHRLGVT